jgi:hypothetical protein
LSVQTKNWKKLTLPFDENIYDAIQQQHHASQFIALVGRHLIPQESDDSNTTMNYQVNEESLIGNPMANGLCVGLQLTDLILYIRDDKQCFLGEIALVGKTKQEVFSELKNKLSQLEGDTSNLKNELHYEIPAHPLEKGAPFIIKDNKLFQESTSYLHNAEIILSELTTEFQNAAPVKVWPHHFDTGSFIPFAYNDKGELSQSIGIGMAIPDSLINEPYYYLSFWSEQPVESFKVLSSLEVGKWITTGWNGGVLGLSEILQCSSADEQKALVRTFFNSGIKILTNHFKK